VREESSADTVRLQQDSAPVSVLFSVPKKAYKKAWKRNLIKRRMKESYRCRKHALVAAVEGAGRHIDIALICMPSAEIPDFATIDNAIAKILDKILARS
jgi:ribonuclease P protein component